VYKHSAENIKHGERLDPTNPGDDVSSSFFDKVMVMDKDPKVRANRIGFLGRLHGTMNRIADLSKLAT
jgi:glycyl-tRNA synthetase beta subunit